MDKSNINPLITISNTKRLKVQIKTRLDYQIIVTFKASHFLSVKIRQMYCIVFKGIIIMV